MNRIIKIKIWSIFFAILSVSVFSQNTTVKMPDELVVPDPYNETYFQDKNDYNNIQRIITISRARYNNFSNDTLQIRYYDNSGLLSRTMRYEKNKPKTQTIYDFDNEKKLLSWKIVEEKYSTLCNYFYDKNGLIAKIIQLKIGNTDTVRLHEDEYNYQNSKLTEWIRNSNGNKTIETFTYRQNQLFSKTGRFISKEFVYDKDGNVTTVTEYMGSEIIPSKIMGSQKFGYNSWNKLIVDSILTSANLTAGKYQVNSYSYNDNGTIKAIKVRYGNSFRNAEFEYLNNRIATVKIETNEANNAYLKFWLNHKIEDYYLFPIQYREVFEYDSHNNMTSKKAYVNKELFSEVEFIIEYKK